VHDESFNLRGKRVPITRGPDLMTFFLNDVAGWLEVAHPGVKKEDFSGK
jgi:hypothetical protein